MTPKPPKPPALALVTGGARRLGAAIAGRLARAGYALALHGHRSLDPEPTLADTLAQQDSDWAAFAADLAEPDAPQGLLDRVSERFGRPPDLIVNAAALFDYDDPATVTAQAIDQHMRVNLTAPVLLATELAKGLDGDARASVVQIVDQRVRQPIGDQLSYTLSKQALAASIRTLATACAPRLRVNGVAPGLTLPTADYGAAQLERLAARMPLAMLPEPGDIADAVLYLAQAERVTGQLIFVDGGAHLKSFERDFLFLETE